MRGERLLAALPDPPSWLPGLITHLADRHCASRACSMVTTLGRLLDDEHSNLPQAVLERARWPGRSMGPLARALEDYFVEHRLALPTDHAQQLAAGRRRRRIEAVPAQLRPAVSAFADSLLHSRERARRAGTRPRSDNTIESALATLRDLARFLHAHRSKSDWATVEVTDIEAFLATAPKRRSRRLAVLRQFFRMAKARRLVLVDPTRGLTAPSPRGYRGRSLPLDRQRMLFRRWTTDPDVHPHEAPAGMFALLHGASSREIRSLRHDDIAPTERTIQLGGRPHPVPLDPATWSVLQRCLDYRQEQRTENPHLIVTHTTRSRKTPASAWYLNDVLSGCDVATTMLRGTRLLDLVNSMDPKIVSAAFGMRPEGATTYLADRIAPTFEADM